MKVEARSSSNNHLMKNTLLVTFLFFLLVLISLPAGPQNQPIRLAAVGDLLLDRGIRMVMEKRGEDYPLEAVTDCLTGYDLAFCNLECPLSERGEAMEKKYVFRGDPSAVETLKKAGFNLFSLANNHTLDYGQEALLDTIDILKSAELYPIGAGKNQKEALQPVIIDKNRLTLAFIAMLGFPLDTGPGQPGIDGLIALVNKIRDQVDFIVVSLHWGFEYEPQPHPRQIEDAHRLIHAGVDLILGHHPHVIQGIERYRGKYILYSLGNFLFDQHDEEGKESYLFGCTLGEDGLLSPHILPIEIICYQSQLATGEKAEYIVDRIRLTTDEGTITFQENNGKYYLKEGNRTSSSISTH